jgi:hypothetical protein
VGQALSSLVHSVPVPFAILLILVGLALLGFGLLLFYVWLPLLLGLYIFAIALLAADGVAANGSSAPILLGTLAGFTAVGARPFIGRSRRILAACLGGSLAALSIAYPFGVGEAAAPVLALSGGVVGGLLVSSFFNLSVIAASACGGATLLAVGVRGLLSIAGEPGGGIVVLLAAAFVVMGIRFQLSQMNPRSAALPGPSRRASWRAD